MHVRAPKDHIHIRILPTMVSGIPLIWGLGTRMSDPSVWVVFWAPACGCLGGLDPQRRCCRRLRRHPVEVEERSSASDFPGTSRPVKGPQ